MAKGLATSVETGNHITNANTTGYKPAGLSQDGICVAQTAVGA